MLDTKISEQFNLAVVDEAFEKIDAKKYSAIKEEFLKKFIIHANLESGKYEPGNTGCEIREDKGNILLFKKNPGYIYGVSYEKIFNLEQADSEDVLEDDIKKIIIIAMLYDKNARVLLEKNNELDASKKQKALTAFQELFKETTDSDVQFTVVGPDANRQASPAPASIEDQVREQPPAAAVEALTSSWSDTIYKNAESLKKYFESFFTSMSNQGKPPKEKGKESSADSPSDQQIKTKQKFFTDMLDVKSVNNKDGNIEIITAAGTSKHTKLDNKKTKKEFFTKDGVEPDLESIYLVYAFEAFIEKKVAEDHSFDPTTLDKTTDISEDQQLAQMDLITINTEDLKELDGVADAVSRGKIIAKHKSACEAAFEIYFKKVDVKASADPVVLKNEAAAELNKKVVDINQREQAISQNDSLSGPEKLKDLANLRKELTDAVNDPANEDAKTVLSNINTAMTSAIGAQKDSVKTALSDLQDNLRKVVLTLPNVDPVLTNWLDRVMGADSDFFDAQDVNAFEAKVDELLMPPVDWSVKVTKAGGNDENIAIHAYLKGKLTSVFQKGVLLTNSLNAIDLGHQVDLNAIETLERHTKSFELVLAEFTKPSGDIINAYTVWSHAVTKTNDTLSKYKANINAELKIKLMAYFKDNMDIHKNIRTPVSAAIKGRETIQLDVLCSLMPKSVADKFKPHYQNVLVQQKKLIELRNQLLDSSLMTKDTIIKFETAVNEQERAINDVVAVFGDYMQELNAGYKTWRKNSKKVKAKEKVFQEKNDDFDSNLNDFITGAKSAADLQGSLQNISNCNVIKSELESVKDKHPANSDIVTSVGKLIAKVDSLKKGCNALTSKLKAVKKLKAELDKVAGHKGSLDTIFSRVTALNKKRIDDPGYKTDWSQINTDFNKLKTEWEKVANAVEAELKTLGVDAASLSALDGYRSLKDGFASVEQQIESAEKNSTAEQHVKRVQAAVESFDKEAGSLSKQVVDGRSNLVDLRKQTDTLAAQVSDLQNSVTQDNDKLVITGGEIEAMSDIMRRAQRQISDFQKKITAEENKRASAPAAEESRVGGLKRAFSQLWRQNGPNAHKKFNEKADEAAEAQGQVAVEELAVGEKAKEKVEEKPTTTVSVTFS